MDYVVLSEELTTDPLGRGYSLMTDAEAATDLNTAYRTHTLEVLDGGVIYDQVDIAEFQGLNTSQQEEVWDIVHLGAGIPVGPESKARARFISIFGVGSITISNLQAAIAQAISRAQELGLGWVKEGHVQKARAL